MGKPKIDVYGRRIRPHRKRNKKAKCTKKRYAVVLPAEHKSEEIEFEKNNRDNCQSESDDLDGLYNVSPSDTDDNWTDVEEDVLNCDQPMEIDNESQPEVSNEQLSTDIILGRRVVNLAHLLSQLESLSRHPLVCTMGRFVLQRETRNGLHSTLVYKCDNCEQVRYVITDPVTSSMHNVNTGLVWGALSCGIGCSQVEELMSVLDVPVMSARTFRKEEERIEKVWEEHLADQMKMAGEEEKKIAIEKGHYVDGVPYITVIGDGGWAKRTYGHGYNSASGVGVIIGAETKKVLFVGVRNAFCSTCARRKLDKDEAPKDHTCYKNFNGPATGMEQSIIVEGFRQSVNMHGLIYKKYIGDGDSSVFCRIQEGVQYGRHVIKIECANHMTRALSDGLHKLSTNTTYPIEVRKLLTVKERGISRLERLVKGVRTAISEAGKKGSVEQLRGDLQNAPYHVFGRHEKCRQEFCLRKGAGENDLIKQLDDAGIFVPIIKLVDVLVRKSDRLAFNETTNHAERYMGLVAKFTGGKRVNYTLKGGYRRRCLGAALSHSRGPSWHTSPWKRLCGRSPGAVMKTRFQRREKARAARCLRYAIQGKQKKKRKNISSGPDKDYGPDAAQPDLSPDELNCKAQNLLTSISAAVDTEDKRKSLERETVGQHENIKWRDARLNRLTASKFGEIVRMRQTTSCHRLVKTILYPKELNTACVTYGRTHERTAIGLYETQTGTHVQRCGLFVHPEFAYLGASPDGIIGSDGLLEVKCLPSVGDRPLVEAALEKHLCVENVRGVLQLRKTHAYYFQVQGQLNICLRDWCDFVVFTGGQGGNIFIQRIFRDVALWEDVMLPKLKTFFLQCMLPEIADPRVPRGMQIRDTKETIVAQTKKQKMK